MSADIVAPLLLLGCMVFAVLCARSAYNCGACDGYGYAREPDHPGYQKAGRYLRRFCSHRWPELNG